MSNRNSHENSDQATDFEKITKFAAVGAAVVSVALWAASRLISHGAIELVHGQPERTTEQLALDQINDNHSTTLSNE